MSDKRSRVFGAVVIGVAAAAFLVAALGVSEADAARGGKKKRHGNHDRPPRDAAAAEVSSAATPHDAGVGEPEPSYAAAPLPSAGLFCLYGQEQEDGGVRCLSPEELDPPRNVLIDTRPIAEKLGMLQAPAPEAPEDGGVAPDAGDRDDESEFGSDGVYKARVVRVQFENGAVGGAMRSLKQARRDIADCVEDTGGLRAESARLKLLFYVRIDGKASGVTVVTARNIPAPVVRCITRLLEGRAMGRPSTDPVGVKTLIELKEREPEKETP